MRLLNEEDITIWSNYMEHTFSVIFSSPYWRAHSASPLEPQKKITSGQDSSAIDQAAAEVCNAPKAGITVVRSNDKIVKGGCSVSIADGTFLWGFYLRPLEFSCGFDMN